MKACSRNTTSANGPASKGRWPRLCRQNDVGVITYFSLAGGFLTGKYRSTADLGKSARGSDVAKYLDARGQRILAALDAVAAQAGATPTRVALAWLMAQPAVDGTDRQRHLRDAAGRAGGGRQSRPSMPAAAGSCWTRPAPLPRRAGQAARMAGRVRET